MLEFKHRGSQIKILLRGGAEGAEIYKERLNRIDHPNGIFIWLNLNLSGSIIPKDMDLKLR